MKKVLVTGAAGFIGSHVVREILDTVKNPKIIAMVRPGEDTASLAGLPVTLVSCDLLDKEGVTRAMEGVDTVFHLAAIYSIWMPDWKPLWEVNLQGSRNVLWAAKNQGVKRVVYTSSIAAIGVRPGREFADETTPFNQYGLGNHYVLSKYLSQQEALGFAENGLDVVVVNPAFPFGENDRGPTPTGKLIIDILKGVNRFEFSGGLNIVDVKDVARGHVLAAQKGRTGKLYILGNRNVTIGELHAMVCEAAGIPPRKIFKLPVFLMKASTHALTAWSNRVSGHAPLSTPPDIEYAANHLFLSNARARNELGLDFTPVEESLKTAVAWFRRNGYI